MSIKNKYYFSPDYQQARSGFAKAAKKAGANYEEKELCPSSKESCDGEKLYMDVAAFNTDSAHTIIVITSGVHGVEGFAGSAVQTGLMLDIIDMKELAKMGIGVLMVHAVNPYGFAFLRRFNEDNVDVNRNFIDFKLYQDNPEQFKRKYSNKPYQDYAHLLERRSRADHRRFFLEIQLFLKIGETFLKNGYFGGKPKILKLMSGQIDNPQGLWYRGTKPSWSREKLTGIFDNNLKNASRLVLLDLHTAIGRYRQTTVLIKDDEKRRQVRNWVNEDSLGKHAVFIRDPPENSPDFYALAPWFADRYKGQDVISATVEFGVKSSPIDILLKVRDETWLHTCKEDCYPKDGSEANTIKMKIKECFIPDEHEWRKIVWKRGKYLFEKMINKLSIDTNTPLSKEN